MPRTLYTPSDYSPTYDVESDGAGNFVKLHEVWDVDPELPQAKRIMSDVHLKCITSESSWQTYLEHQRWLGRTP